MVFLNGTYLNLKKKDTDKHKIYVHLNKWRFRSKNIAKDYYYLLYTFRFLVDRVSKSPLLNLLPHWANCVLGSEDINDSSDNLPTEASLP